MKKSNLTMSLVFTLTLFLAGNAYAIEFSFDADTNGEPPSGWTERYSAFGGTPEYTREEAAALGVSVQVDDTIYFGSSGKSVHFLDTSVGTAPGVGISIRNSFTSASSLTLEYYMRSNNDSYEGAFVFLEGDGGTDYVVGFENGQGGPMAGYIGVIGWNGGWIKPDLLPYNENEWYYVKRVLDLTGLNNSYFYVEEVDNPLNSAYYEIGSNYANTYVNSVYVVTSNSQGADSYIDALNIIPVTGPIPPIPAVPEPATMLLLGSGLAGLAGFRRKFRKR